MIAFVFPGQGSQYVGMGKELAAKYPIAKTTFEEANDALGFDLRKLCFEGDAEELKLTANAQPAILAHSVAAMRVIEQESDLAPSYLAGHSLGEYTALVASGAIEFSDALRVVRKRGEFMQNAVPAGIGVMVAVLGNIKRSIRSICVDASVNGTMVSPANYNAPGQVVISGHKEAVDKASDLAKESGARRVVLLETSAPFHCSLMAPAADKLREVLNSIDINGISIPVVTNLEAEPNDDPSRIAQLLYDQMMNPVRWDRSVEKMVELGVENFIEIGPGHILSGLIRRIARDKKVHGTDSIEKLEKITNAGI